MAQVTDESEETIIYDEHTNKNERVDHDEPVTYKQVYIFQSDI